MNSIAAEKTVQAVSVLREQGVDLWLTLVRETSLTPDPVLDLVLGFDLVWPSAVLIARDGTRIAIVGRFDAGNVRATGAYDEVIGYDEDLRVPLLAAIERLAPGSIAINTSDSDPAADGLTHGLFLKLQEYLVGTPYAARLASAGAIVAAVRGRKTPLEVARMRAAAATTLDILAGLTPRLAPGLSEEAIAGWVHAAMETRGLGAAWDRAYCPAVNAGPDSPVGHGMPGEWRTQRGQCLHIDVGVLQDGYCSDVQRMWYFLDRDETQPPADVLRAFAAVRVAIEAARVALRPGVRGWEVDAAARSAFVAAGYPEYLHATGHQLGRTAHDGATVLGPRWPRYGSTPDGVVEIGNAFTLELGALVPQRGYVSLEEDVLVTAGGAEYLAPPQTEITCV